MHIDSLRILEIGDTPFFQPLRPSQVAFFYVGKKSSYPKNFLTYRQFRQLRRDLASLKYDLVVFSSFGVSGVPWRQDRSLFSNLLRMLRCWLGPFCLYGTWIVSWLLRDIDVPFLVLDRKDDPNVIPAHYLPLLERCDVYFWREYPVKLESGFFSTSRLGDTSAVRNSSIFKHNRHKVRPISIGADHDAAFNGIDLQYPKVLDVFFAGFPKGEAREKGLPLLKELQEEGLRIEFENARKYSREEFFKRCAESWLVWSPEGHGWDCYRHYEVGLAGSVPMMNYPRTYRYQPLIDGVHGFYYGVEGEDLKRVIRQALSDKDKLRVMAKAGREHVLKYHTYDKLASYMLSYLFPEENK